ncbi:hypothetical protein CLSA_c31130 [Clostridium saccharobutylicum DSM 13864]|uniref:Uncharacterized protein n=1 Tax=Clostridium saccharobutylicum DSM 13864 TaxID=1345695 RepID=U5MTG7_CLOSA|nr:hypothetical protein CLSA_c31130 [Clostridium saccharobutylicum DSM 13864]
MKRINNIYNEKTKVNYRLNVDLKVVLKKLLYLKVKFVKM